MVAESEAPLGPIYSFVPAGDALHAQDLGGKLSQVLRVHLASESGGRTVLLADFFE